MGQQREIQSFFRKDCAASTNSAPTYGTEAVAATGARLFESSPATCDSPQDALEHDPNPNRRKRRKTKDLTEIIENSLVEKSPGNCSETLKKTFNTTSQTTAVGKVGQAHDTRFSELPLVIGQPQTSDPVCDDLGKLKLASEGSPGRKTLKLYANGKLLSSPTVAAVENQPCQKSKGRSSKASDRKTKGLIRRLAILKYGREDSHRQRVGSLIDDIFSGQSKQDVPAHPIALVNTKGKLLPKSTHPFFLKKPVCKADTAGQSPQLTWTLAVAGPKEENIQKDRLFLNLSSSRGGHFESFKQQPRLPEPIRPLWPPRDFIHTRGLNIAKTQRPTAFDPVSMDRKKAKTAAIQIGDHENVLLSTYTQAQDIGAPQAVSPLRVSERQIISGRALQEELSKQLSGSFAGDSTRGKHSSKYCHPAIKRLSTSLSSHTTAFDRGEPESLPWTHKYTPNTAEEVLQTSREPSILKNWLQHLTVSAVDTGSPPKNQMKTAQWEDSKRRSKRRKKAELLDGFIVSSESEQFEMSELSDSDSDELAGNITFSSKRTVVRSGDLGAGAKFRSEKGCIANAILLSGPPGCGKTASVHAVAKELGFGVFEINPGSRRSSKDILEQVGDMARNHLVGGLRAHEGQTSGSNSQSAAGEQSKQGKMNGFLKPIPTKQLKRADKRSGRGGGQSQKQSLILFEEADILFEEDKQFWSGVISLISQSKRPIVITCNDESLIPLEDISLHAILRYRAPQPDLVTDYLLLLAANEGHVLKREAIEDLYVACKKDLRKTITQLSFWCQMGVGSEKSGLDWIISRWPPGSNVDELGDPLRVTSLDTYRRFMGWLGRDVMLGNTLDSEIVLNLECFYWWDLGIQDFQNMPKFEIPCGLQEAFEVADMRSDLDMLCSFSYTIDQKKDAIDMSSPPISEKQRMNYAGGYPLLQADLESNYTLLPTSICSAVEVLTRRVSEAALWVDAGPSQELQILANANRPACDSLSVEDALATFEPIMEAASMLPAPTGRLAPSFERGSGPLFEDLAPYIRGIAAFDVRLERHRQELSCLLSQGPKSTKRVRRTKASRAALEGGSKSNTRKERWFPPGTSPTRILATGKEEWQDLLAQRGYFVLGSVGSKEDLGDGDNYESSGDGGI